MVPLAKTFTLPGWVPGFLSLFDETFGPPEDRMEFVLCLTAKNVECRTGGPFGAAVFDQSGGKLVAVGVNLVVPTHDSCLHAEQVALTLAEEARCCWDLGEHGTRSLELVSSAQPCLMCMGACLWSGIRSLVFAADSTSVQAATGFDEGPVPPDWQAEFARRGITVRGGLMAERSLAILADYASHGIIYNGRSA